MSSEEVFKLVAADDVEKVLDLLQAKVQEVDDEGDANRLKEFVNSPDWDHGGRTLFLQACFSNNLKIVEVLIQVLGYEIIDINAKDNQGCTALHYAVKSKNWELAKALLSCPDLNANAKDHLLGRTPLHTMIASIHTDLTENPAKSDSIIEVFQLLVDKSDVNIACNSAKDGVLHRIASRSQNPLSILKIVLKSEVCDINLQNEIGETALMVALEQNNTAHAIVLIEKGADLFAVNKHRETSLHIACRKNQLDVLRLMLSTRISPLSVGDWDGNTPLHYAAARGFYEAVQMLVHLAEAPINLRNLYGETALHLAVEGGFTDIVELLIEEDDCDLEARTNSQENVIDIANCDYRKNLHPTISRILVSAIQNKKMGRKRFS